MNWIQTAKFFIASFILFVLGTYGQAFFVWVHEKIVECNSTYFGMVCNMLSALVIIYILWRITYKQAI
ncbi:hypothetical protein ABHN09_02115 [Bacillus paramobilis]|uniref:hypothetical protein n=1 Tax=Bacillus paramobilis TaxID=2817477 RepID=UPI003D23F987